jgi:hypothetical protein
MKHTLFFSLVIAALMAAAVQAQDTGSTVRIEAQHKTSSATLKPRLASYEVNLLQTLENDNPTMQAQAVQTVRELAQLFPSHPFKTMIAPLGKKLKDEKADATVRQLAALALDELHSDAGDLIIKEAAKNSEDKGIRSLCTALLVRSQYK